MTAMPMATGYDATANSPTASAAPRASAGRLNESEKATMATLDTANSQRS